jgi:hypothetical protein
MKEEGGALGAGQKAADVRGDAAREAQLDLKKSPYQLLADVHEELVRSERPVEQNIVHAWKRIASLMARTAESNEQTTNRIIRLTRVIIFLTVVLVVLTVVLVVLTVIMIVAK